MRAEKQTSKHLLLATIVGSFGLLLVLITIAMSWELWMVPILVVGSLGVWLLHIERLGTEKFYENLCSTLLLIGFFFFGIHSTSLFDLPAVAGIVLFIYSLLDKRWTLYTTAALYVLVLLYHASVLHTISADMTLQDVVRLGFGVLVTAGALEIARYRINRRRIERLQQESTLAQLETAGRQNAVFLSNVSHELRTPINMVLGISDVTLEKKLSPEIREDIQSIQRAGKRLSNQINNILNYTEIVEGTLTPVEEEYMITSVLNNVLTMAALQNNRNGLEIVFDIDPKMPAALVGDAEKISQVLKTLLENALKFTEAGGINICIGYRKENYGINLLIDIDDTGIGMTDAQMEQMYDDFYQADSGSSRFVGGLGLGIPIARGLLNAMGGFIHFDSKGQQGLQVHIAVPQTVADESPCMSLPNAGQLCIACYFRPERYNCDEVRSYYDKLILHLVEGLGIEGYQAHNFEGLLKLQRSHALTHVVIAQSEYEENQDYYEDLADTLQVVVIADREYVLSRESKLQVLYKPLSALAVVNLLGENGQEAGQEGNCAAGTGPLSYEGIRVLAVDDEEMNLVVAKGVLGSYGIQVDTCLSGREAIEKCRETVYDVIFLDHMMPGFDGVETLRRIREMNNGVYQELPVIALTANTISGAREMFRNEGFTEFIPKPIERTILERVLRKVLPEPGSPDLPEEEPLSQPDSWDDEENPQPAEAGKGESALPLEQLEKAGIQTQMGIDYCGGDEEFYLEMLQMFGSQSGTKRQELEDLYEAENWADYGIKAHALKSTSLTIGAQQLSEQAKALEMAGKNGDEEYIRQNHAALLRQYEEVCESLAGLYRQST